MRRDPQEFITSWTHVMYISPDMGKNSLVFLYFFGRKKMLVCGSSNLFYPVEILQDIYNGNIL